jgi:hypothetical protein
VYEGVIGRIYLHLGWPKTGTTSLQATLAAQRSLLAGGGLVYPRMWSHNGDDSHNDLADLRRNVPGGFDDLLAFLAGETAPRMLLSVESFTSWLLREESLEALIGLLNSLRETAPVNTIWTLRRIDDMALSLYEQLSRAGIASVSAERFTEQVPCERIFSGMRTLTDLEGVKPLYLRYDRHGTHNFDLLDRLDLPAEIPKALKSQLRSAARLNAGQGVRVEEESRRALRERALKSAQSCGFAPYLSFFGTRNTVPS